MKKKIQKKEVAKNYFSNTSAILIVLGLPVVVGLIPILTLYKELYANIEGLIIAHLFICTIIGFLLELPIMGVLAGLYAVFSKFRKKHKIYDSRYLSKKWTFFIMIVPIGFLLGSLFNPSILLFFVLISPVLGFLLLTKRVRWHWTIVLLMFGIGSIFLHEVYQYMTRDVAMDKGYEWHDGGLSEEGVEDKTPDYEMW